MNKQQLLARREYFNMVHHVTIRAIGAFAEEELEFRPRPLMRTPRELIFHIYSQEKLLAEAAQQGRFTLEAANRAWGALPDNRNPIRDTIDDRGELTCKGQSYHS